MTMFRVRQEIATVNITVFKLIPKTNGEFHPSIFKPNGMFDWKADFIFAKGFPEFKSPARNGYMASDSKTGERFKVKGYHAYTTRQQAIKERLGNDTVQAFVIPKGTRIYVADAPKGIIAAPILMWRYESYV